MNFPLRSGHEGRLCSAWTDVTAYPDLAATASLMSAAVVVHTWSRSAQDTGGMHQTATA